MFGTLLEVFSLDCDTSLEMNVLRLPAVSRSAPPVLSHPSPLFAVIFPPRAWMTGEP